MGAATLGLAASWLFRLHRLSLRGVAAILSTLTRCEECFPLNALRIVDPILFAVRIAARRGPFLDYWTVRSSQPPVDDIEFGPIFCLNAQVSHPDRRTALTDREVHARVLQHPFCVVALAHCGLNAKQSL
jgi:hypothetical protein